MSNWLKGEGGARVYLAGVLVSLVYSTQEKAFLLSTALGNDDGAISNVKTGVGIDGKAAPTVTCWHKTVPRTNFTAFYRRLNIHDIILIGSGQHTSSNTKYSVQWANGTNGNLDLNKTGTGAELITDPKRLNALGNPR
jgi:hypothetical protein